MVFLSSFAVSAVNRIIFYPFILSIYKKGLKKLGSFWYNEVYPQEQAVLSVHTVHNA